jgi:prepilin-type N-terminal cleavage/methylation domain-containing protein
MVAEPTGYARDPGDPVFAARAGRERGFTLVEVLFALVILAVGLLALQALSVVAVRGAGLADRNTRAVSTAMRYLEDAVAELRLERLAPELSCTFWNGDQLVRAVEVGSNPRLARVTVTVVPEPRGSPPRPYTASAHVFSPDGFAEAAGATGCP